MFFTLTPWLAESLSSFFSLREGGLHSLSEQSRRRPGPKFYFSAPHPTRGSSILARSYFFFCVLRHKIDSLAATDGRDGERRKGGKAAAWATLFSSSRDYSPLLFPSPLSSFALLHRCRHRHRRRRCKGIEKMGSDQSRSVGRRGWNGGGLGLGGRKEAMMIHRSLHPSFHPSPFPPFVLAASLTWHAKTAEKTIESHIIEIEGLFSSPKLVELVLPVPRPTACVLPQFISLPSPSVPVSSACHSHAVTNGKRPITANGGDGERRKDRPLKGEH